MAELATLPAEARRTKGKGAARTLRREGRIPAVIYGHGREAEALTLDAAVLQKLLGTATMSTIIDVSLDGKEPVKALIREIQRNPVRPIEILHVDLYEVRSDETVTVEVPVHLIGVPDGVRNAGGVLDHSLRELEVEVLPANIPASIDIDVTALTIGRSIFVRDVQVSNLEILNDPDVPICSVVPPRTEEAATVTATEAVAEEGEPELIRKPKPEEEEEGEGEGEARG